MQEACQCSLHGKPFGKRSLFVMLVIVVCEILTLMGPMTLNTHAPYDFALPG